MLNRSLSQVEYINVLNWQANPNNENSKKYKIYLVDGKNKNLLDELDASTTEYWHKEVEKNKPYTYALAAVNDEGREGEAAYLTVK